MISPIVLYDKACRVNVVSYLIAVGKTMQINTRKSERAGRQRKIRGSDWDSISAER